MEQTNSLNYKKIQWCCEQKSGIKLINPNENLVKSYLDGSEEDFQMLINCSSKKWQIIVSYYSCYNALYALLQKSGIKSEIHDCTIELMKIYNFTNNEINYIKELKNKREKAQYYNETCDVINLKEINTFRLKCKQLLKDTNHNIVRNLITPHKAS